MDRQEDDWHKLNKMLLGAIDTLKSLQSNTQKHASRGRICCFTVREKTLLLSALSDRYNVLDKRRRNLPGMSQDSLVDRLDDLDALITKIRTEC